MVTHQSVTVSVEPGAVHPGQPVEVTVVVAGAADHKVRNGSVRLVRTDTASEHQVGAYVDYNAQRDREVVAAEATLGTGEGTSSFSFTVPEDALPSAADGVEWSLRAVIERHRGLDAKAKVALTVLAPHRSDAEALTALPQRKGRGFVDVELDRRSFRPGDTVTGRAILRPTEPIRGASISVGFNRVDSYDADPHCYKGDWKAIAPPGDMTAGEVHVSPFELVLPADAAPTVDGSRLDPPSPVVVCWSVRVNSMLAHSMADNDVRLDFEVYNTPGP